MPQWNESSDNHAEMALGDRLYYRVDRAMRDELSWDIRLFLKKPTGDSIIRIWQLHGVGHIEDAKVRATARLRKWLLEILEKVE